MENFDPYLLKGMDKAVERLLAALDREEPITIYGDFDADGITATALLVGFLRERGGVVDHYIPSRFIEGYGLNIDALTEIRNRGSTILITVDCGIRALSEVEHAVGLGMDIIITDHHHPGDEIPQALAVINPKQHDDTYPYKGLAGVGLAYKVAQAVNRGLGESDPQAYLDLVAIGTVADLAPLNGENRSFVREGLDRLQRNDRPGIASLVEISGVKGSRISATTIGYSIGPRLNAAGRLYTAETAFNLLLETDNLNAQVLAQKLETYNRERQQVTLEMVEKARVLGVGEDDPSELIFVVDPDFNEGVVGLAASRLVEEFYRPAIVAVQGEEYTRASGRSIPEFHLTEALESCSDLLERFGGHSAAAGFSVLNINLVALEERLRLLAQQELSQKELRPGLEIDAVVDFRELDESLYEFIQKLEPCGNENPSPVFAALDVSVKSKRQVGKEKNHLKLAFSQEGLTFDAIAFRQGHLMASLPDNVDIAFRLERNEYWSVPSLELTVLDVRSAGSMGDDRLTSQASSWVNL
jgi:single-stranded-DNA-specific exonuclease